MTVLRQVVEADVSADPDALRPALPRRGQAGGTPSGMPTRGR